MSTRPLDHRCCRFLLGAWAVGCLLGCARTPATQVTEAAFAQQTQQIRAAVGPYYDVLAAYGEWLYSADDGWVWVPAAAVVGADFFPYASAGHWSYTDRGWLFVSDWSWGWAPFHYGRWTYGQWGWAWVPGVVWAPAWVDWRSGGGYVGWAPLPPPQSRGDGPASSHWVFVLLKDLFAVNLRQRLVSPERAAVAYQMTQPVHQTVSAGDDIIWYQGPAVEGVEQAAGVAIARRRMVLPTRAWLSAIDIDAHEVRTIPQAPLPRPEQQRDIKLPSGSQYHILREPRVPTPQHRLPPEARSGSTWEPMDRLNHQRWPGAIPSKERQRW